MEMHWNYLKPLTVLRNNFATKARSHKDLKISLQFALRPRAFAANKK